MSGKRKFGSRQLVEGIIAISTVMAAAITIIDSYNTRGVVWQTIQTGEPLLVAVILLQTPWFLFGVLLLGGLLKSRYKKKLTGNRAMWTGIGALIAGFLLTWGVRASYFGISGQNYPGQELLEFRLQTVVAGVLFFLFGIIVAVFTIFAEESDESPTDLLDGERMLRVRRRILRQDIERLRQLQVKHNLKHDSLCESLEKTNKDRGMVHYYARRNVTDCPCSCHK